MAYNDIELFVYSPTRSAFEAMVSSGKVTTSQIGIIAETGEFWENGNYHPLVLLTDYLKKDDAVNFAKDLTGTIEATPEEFTFRPSAGDKSIRDESALIRRIKGNTSVWGQLAEWTGIDNKGQSTLATYEISDNSLDITYNKAGVPPQVYIFSSPLYPAVTGHKYLCTIDVKTSKSLGLMLYPWYDVFLRFTSNQSWTTHSAFYTPTRTEFTNRFYFRFQSAANQTMEVGDSIHCRNLQFFDLTQIFGAGNEPTTIEEFRKYYPDAYYPYCEPEVRPMRATGIETIGANAFNKEDVVGGTLNADGTITSNDVYSVANIEVVPNETYTLTNVANGALATYTYAFYDSNYAFLYTGAISNSVTQPTYVSGDVIVPMNARYMRVVVHNDYVDSCCVNLKHTGTLDPMTATYFKDVRMLPDIAKYFPDGMHGIGDVYDEINDENAIKRFGVVDLGTLTWATTTATSGTRRWYSASLKGIIKKSTSSSVKIKAVCTKYDIVTADNTWFNIDGLSGSAGDYIYIYDSNYDASTTPVADFVASLQGVMLYYELAEPETTPLSEPIQLDYKVADYGTEKMLSTLPSAPFRADIVYQFNASDRIRDNARNIERLEDNMSFVEELVDGSKKLNVGEILLSHGVIMTNDKTYGLPSALYETDETLATENYIQEHMPTVAAPAMPRVEQTKSSFTMTANTVHYYTGGVGVSIAAFSPSATPSVDDVWVVRFAPAANVAQSLSITPTVYWKDGNSLTTLTQINAIYEVTFKYAGDDVYIGEYKIFKP